MKKNYYYTLLLLSILALQCTQSKKIVYNIPTGMHGKNKEIMLANIEQGSILFKRTCSNCHGIFTKGKEDMPNFTDKQIESYQMMYKLRNPKNHAFAKKLIPEEMDQIALFLKYINADATHK
jgi:mono/diheme cytochrome c family protein